MSSNSLSASEIAESLAADVHAGFFSAGEMLPPERELCEKFGVSRNLIRESLTMLQSMGLTDQTKGKRPRVVAPTLSNVLEGMSDATKFFF